LVKPEKVTERRERSIINSPIVIGAKKTTFASKSKNTLLRNAKVSTPKIPKYHYPNSKSINDSDKENIPNKLRNQVGLKNSPVIATLKQHPKTKVDHFNFLKIDKKLYKLEVLDQDSDYGFGEGKGFTGFKDQLFDEDGLSDSCLSLGFKNTSDLRKISSDMAEKATKTLSKKHQQHSEI